MATYEKSIRTTRTYNVGYYYYKVDVTENSYSEADLTSNVTAVLSMKGPWAESFYDYTLNCGIILGGYDGNQSGSVNTSPYMGNTYVELMRITRNIKHAPDGSWTMPVKCWIYNAYFGNEDYLPLWFSSSSSPQVMGNMVLTTIPVEAKFGTVADFCLEDKVNIAMTPSPYLDEFRIIVNDDIIVSRDGFGGELILTAEELAYAYSVLGCPSTNEATLTLRTFKDGSLMGSDSTTADVSTHGQIILNSHRYVMGKWNGASLDLGALTKGGSR